MVDVHLQTARAFGEDPETMRRYHGNEFYNYEVTAKRVKGRVLDIACGTGTGTRLLADHAKEVIGADIDGPTLAFCRRTHRKKNLRFVKADATKRLPFHDKYFDTVATLQTIEHFYPDERKRYLAELRRVLRDDGELIVTTYLNGIEEQTRPCPPLKHPYDHKIEFCLRELKEELVAADFAIKEIGGIYSDLDPRVIKKRKKPAHRSRILEIVIKFTAPISKYTPAWIKERIAHPLLKYPYDISHYAYTTKDPKIWETVCIMLRKSTEKRMTRKSSTKRRGILRKGRNLR